MNNTGVHKKVGSIPAAATISGIQSALDDTQQQKQLKAEQTAKIGEPSTVAGATEVDSDSDKGSSSSSESGSSTASEEES